MGQWLAEASNPGVVPPVTTMRPPSTHHVEENRPPSSAERASQSGMAAATPLFEAPPHPPAGSDTSARTAPTVPPRAPLPGGKTLRSEGNAAAQVPTVPRSFQPLPVAAAGEGRPSLSGSALVDAMRGGRRTRLLAFAVAALVLVAVVLLVVSQSGGASPGRAAPVEGEPSTSP